MEGEHRISAAGQTAGSARYILAVVPEPLGAFPTLRGDHDDALPPLLVLYLARLREALAGPEPDWCRAVHALKETAELCLKLCHVTVVAEALELGGPYTELGPEERSIQRQLARRILAERPTTGSMHRTLVDLSRTDRLLGTASAHARSLAGALRSGEGGRRPISAFGTLADWRNRYHGHGVTGDVATAAKETVAHLDHLEAALHGLRGPLAAFVLTPGSREDAASDGVHPLIVVGRTLGPLLVELVRSGEASRWFFEGLIAGRAMLREASSGAELPLGHEGALPELMHLRRLAGPDDLEPARRGRVSQPESDCTEVGWLQHMQELQFASFTSRYVEPTYLIQAVERALLEDRHGTAIVRGAGGVGKSFLLRGLIERWRARSDLLVLTSFLTRGAGGHSVQLDLISDLKAEVGRLRRERSVQLPHSFMGDLAPGSLARRLQALVQANPHVRVILVLDGLDEIDPDEASALLDALAAPTLPDRLQYLVSWRSDDERRALDERLARLPAAVEVRIDAASRENCELLGKYLRKHAGGIADDATRTRLIEQGDKRFLYVHHIARWIDLVPSDEVTDATALYRAVFRWLVDRGRRFGRYGHALERTLLALALAHEPVPLEVLVSAGVDADLVEEALLDLRDFLAREPSHDGAPRYRLHHAAVGEFLRSDPQWSARLRDVETEWIERMLAIVVRADVDLELDPAVDYALAHLGDHAESAGDRSHVERLVAASFRLGKLARARAREFGEAQRVDALLRLSRGTYRLAVVAHLHGAVTDVRLRPMLRRDVARAARALAGAARRSHQLEAAAEAASHAFGEALEQQDLAMAQASLGDVARELGDVSSANSLYRDALKCLGDGPPAETVGLLAHAAETAVLAGDLTRARSLYRRAIKAGEAATNGGSVSLREVAMLALVCSHACRVEERAVRDDLAARSLRHAERAVLLDGKHPDAARCHAAALECLADQAERRGAPPDLVHARELLHECLAARRRALARSDSPLALAELAATVGRLADVARRSGRLEEAGTLSEECVDLEARRLEHGETPRSLRAHSFALVRAGATKGQLGEFVEARDLLGRALEQGARALSAGRTQDALVNLCGAILRYAELLALPGVDRARSTTPLARVVTSLKEMATSVALSIPARMLAERALRSADSVEALRKFAVETLGTMGVVLDLKATCLVPPPSLDMGRSTTIRSRDLDQVVRSGNTEDGPGPALDIEEMRPTSPEVTDRTGQALVEILLERRVRLEEMIRSVGGWQRASLVARCVAIERTLCMHLWAKELPDTLMAMLAGAADDERRTALVEGCLRAGGKSFEQRAEIATVLVRVVGAVDRPDAALVHRLLGLIEDTLPVRESAAQLAGALQTLARMAAEIGSIDDAAKAWELSIEACPHLPGMVDSLRTFLASVDPAGAHAPRIARVVVAVARTLLESGGWARWPDGANAWLAVAKDVELERLVQGLRATSLPAERSGQANAWRYGVIVKAQAILHARGAQAPGFVEDLTRAGEALEETDDRAEALLRYSRAHEIGAAILASYDGLSPRGLDSAPHRKRLPDPADDGLLRRELDTALWVVVAADRIAAICDDAAYSQRAQTAFDAFARRCLRTVVSFDDPLRRTRSAEGRVRVRIVLVMAYARLAEGRRPLNLSGLVQGLHDLGEDLARMPRTPRTGGWWRSGAGSRTTVAAALAIGRAAVQRLTLAPSGTLKRALDHWREAEKLVDPAHPALPMLLAATGHLHALSALGEPDAAFEAQHPLVRSLIDLLDAAVAVV